MGVFTLLLSNIILEHSRVVFDKHCLYYTILQITVTPLGAISRAEIECHAFFENWLLRAAERFSSSALWGHKVHLLNKFYHLYQVLSLLNIFSINSHTTSFIQSLTWFFTFEMKIYWKQVLFMQDYLQLIQGAIWGKSIVSLAWFSCDSTRRYYEHRIAPYGPCFMIQCKSYFLWAAVFIYQWIWE